MSVKGDKIKTFKDCVWELRKNEDPEFEDPIFGKLKLTIFENKAMLDTFEFNRLHHIKQQGLQQLIRPSSTPTRCSHAIGSTVLVNRCLDNLRKDIINTKIVEDDDDFRKNRVYVTLAMMLHDIGHLPFSHVLERYGKNIIRKSHEEITRDLIMGNSKTHSEGENKEHSNEINVFEAFRNKFYGDRDHNRDRDCFLKDTGLTMVSEKLDELKEEKEEKNRIDIDREILCNFIKKDISKVKKIKDKFKDEHVLWCLIDLVDGTVDVDRVDHIARDIYYTGFKAASFDPERIIECYTIQKEDDNWSLCIKREYVPYIVGMLFARELVQDYVWNNPDAVGYNVMLEKAVQMEIEIEKNKEFKNNFYVYNDYELLDKLLQSDNKTVKALAEQIMFRTQPYQMACEITNQEIPDLDDLFYGKDDIELLYSKISEIEKDIYNKFKPKIEQMKFNYDEGIMILHVPKEPKIKEIDVKVYDKKNKEIKHAKDLPGFKNVFDWFKTNAKNKWGIRVYCPYPIWRAIAKDEEDMKNTKAAVKKIIEEYKK